MLNQLKTVILLGVLTSILLLIGQLVGGASGLTIAFLFAIVMNVGSYWFSDKIVLRMYRAQPLLKAKAPKIHAMVEDIARKAGIPKPKIYRIPTDALNAFATGRNEKNAVVAVTDGIVKVLKQNELKGVLAHEIAHIKNRDILVSTVAATIASVIAYIAFMARFAAIFGGRDSEGMGNILELLVLAIVAPVGSVKAGVAVKATANIPTINMINSMCFILLII